MEHAARLSSPVWPASEEAFSFRVYQPEQGEAQIKIGVATPMTKRLEFTYRDYRMLQVQNGTEFSTSASEPSEPAPLVSVRKTLPAFIGQFDAADMIERIDNRTVDGQQARCVVFKTVKGDHQIPGRACVDAASGWLIEVTQGDDIIRQSRFYAFNDGFLPGHIERWRGNEKLFEIDERIVVREQWPEGYFNAPAAASVRHMCNSYTPVTALRTEQPSPNTITNDAIDVRVHGIVGKDGKPYSLKVLDNPRTDLSQEALKIVAQWTFEPAQCNYQPSTMETDFVLHFKGW